MVVYLVVFEYNYEGADMSSIKGFFSEDDAKDYLKNCKLDDGRFKNEDGDYFDWAGIRSQTIN